MPKPMPAAEVDVSAHLVWRLLADQHPDLASLPVSFLASGWDNAMYRLGPRSLARLPRRALGAMAPCPRPGARARLPGPLGR